MLKYHKSLLFPHRSTTNQQLELQFIINQYKQKLNLNSQSTSTILHPSNSIEHLNARQASTLQNLASKVRTASFHRIYESCQKGRKKDEGELINPERMRMFKSGQSYRSRQRPQKQRIDESIKQSLMEYFERRPEEEQQNHKLVHQKIRIKQLRTSAANSMAKRLASSSRK